MIWLTWRQFRTPALVVYAALAVVAALLAATGPHLADLYRTYGTRFFEQLAADTTDRTLLLVGTATVYVLPAVVGAFWGAPLIARELETGTHLLTWNQSVPRSRWLASKVGLLGGAAIVAGLVSAALTWWRGPIDSAIGASAGAELSVDPRLSARLFGALGVVPIGYAVFAFVVGVTIGLLLRRTVAAMAATLVVVAAVQILVPLAVVPHLLAPVTTNVAITPKSIRSLAIARLGGGLSQVTVTVNAPGAWITASQTVDRSGNPSATLPTWTNGCTPAPGQEPTPKVSACFARLAREGYHQRVQYLAARRFWPLQWLVTAMLFGLSLSLTGFCFWWLDRRLS